MKASDLSKNFVAKFLEEVSGIEVKVEVPELDMEFYIFPAQPVDIAFMFRNGPDDIKYDKNYAARLICARAKKKDGTALMDNDAEKEKLYKIMTTSLPSSFTNEVAARVINEIENAFPTTKIDEAGND